MSVNPSHGSRDPGTPQVADSTKRKCKEEELEPAMTPPPLPSRPRKQKHPRPNPAPTLEDLEEAKGMVFEKMEPKNAVHSFCVRYCARDVVKDVDYQYVLEYSGGMVGGMVSVKLHVWVWSQDRSYPGGPVSLSLHGSKARHIAEKQAAQSFLADPDVVIAAKKLPPPIDMIRRYCWHKVMSEERKERADESAADLQGSLEIHMQAYMTQCYFDGCRNAITDRKA